MTFVLISSSGTMALAVNFGYRRDRKTTFILLLATAALGATFVGMQAFEWSKLILEGVRPWGNPWGAAQFGSAFFMITGFHGTHVTIGVIFLVDRGGEGAARRPRPAAAGLPDRPQGQLRDRRDPGPVLALRRPGLGLHLRVLLSLVGRSRHMEHAEHPHAAPHASSPLHTHRASSTRSGIYFKIWGLLFVLSAASYMVDYFHVQGLLRWTLIIVFMLLKAGLIVSVFMHMLWERLALVYAILVPPLLLLVLLGIGALEADYTFLTRGTFFAP